MPTSDVLDRAALQSLLDNVGGDLDFLRELIDSYFQDAPRLIADLQQAATSNQPAGLQLAAHSLKSVSATFGARHLAALCKELEMMGRAGSVDGAAVLLPQVEAEYARVHEALVLVHAAGV